MHLLQQLTKTIACAQHAHLERRNPDARHLRHLLVTQVLDVLHQKRFPLIRPDKWSAAAKEAGFKDEVMPLLLKENAARVLGL